MLVQILEQVVVFVEFLLVEVAVDYLLIMDLEQELQDQVVAVDQVNIIMELLAVELEQPTLEVEEQVILQQEQVVQV
jgi:hypothetical protein